MSFTLVKWVVYNTYQFDLLLLRIQCDIKHFPILLQLRFTPLKIDYFQVLRSRLRLEMVNLYAEGLKFPHVRWRNGRG